MAYLSYRRTFVMLIILVLISFLFGYQVATAAPRAIASPVVPGWLKGGLQFLRFEANGNGSEIGEKDMYILYEIFDAIDSEFIEGDELDPQEVIYGAASGAVAALGDPYSRFVPPIPTKELRADIEGYYFGIGVSIEERAGHVVLVNVFPESPAEKAGLISGDIISKVDGEDVLTAGSLHVVEVIRGPEGTTVDIGVFREGEGEELVFTVERSNIKYPSVWESKLMDGGIGYVNVTQFTRETPDDLREALAQLKAEGARSIILDLRNNAGGPLDAAVLVTDIFVPEGEMVFLQDRAGEVFPAPIDETLLDGGDFVGLPLVVMINQFSASASEIVAGAVQDYDMGVVMGQRSFGKGVVQNVIKLSDGSSLVLTTNKYLTPNKRDINEVGIEPDIPISLEPEDIEDEFIVSLLEDLEDLDQRIRSKNEELRNYLRDHDFQLEVVMSYLNGEINEV